MEIYPPKEKLKCDLEPVVTSGGEWSASEVVKGGERREAALDIIKPVALHHFPSFISRRRMIGLWTPKFGRQPRKWA